MPGTVAREQHLAVVRGGRMRRVPIMRIRPGRRHTTEDSLRSLGAVLDAVRARGVIIRELRSGLLVRAQVAATLQDRLDGVWRPIDRLVSRGEMARYRREALARRGTGHVAGPHERSLRMIGRHIEERGLVGMTIIQHGTEGSWLLWSAGPDEASATLAVLDDHELHFRDAAEAVRREAATGRPGDTTAHVGHL